MPSAGYRVSNHNSSLLCKVLKNKGVEFSHFIDVLKVTNITGHRYYSNPRLMRIEQVERLSFATGIDYIELVRACSGVIKGTRNWYDDLQDGISKQV